MSKKWVYLFDEGNTTMKDLLGGKGANLAEMTNAGLPVPPGFTITTEACNAYFEASKQFPPGLWDQVAAAVHTLEERTGKKLGDPANPLLVSVRSGAKFSMPGMMDTVLNLGLNDETDAGLARLTGNERFALDAYRRFIAMFGRIVMDADGRPFEDILDKHKAQTAGGKDTDLTTAMLRDIVQEFKAQVRRQTGQDFPTDPYEQMRMAIQAVFASWFGKRAVDYRNNQGIPHDLGTAVNVQTMVFGNMGEDSGTGVAFTRNPATGERKLYGEYLMNAQGEDVVAGVRTPHPIADMNKELPAIYQQFAAIAERLEQHYRDVQDMEFTIERGKLYMLQTRNGKRTADAAVNIAVDMVNEGLITKQEAVMRIEPRQVEQLLHRRIDPNAPLTVIAQGLNASPGAGSGMAAFDPDTAEKWAREGKKVILVRLETSPDDVHGMISAQGILTARGGATSHAAVVARGLGKPCVSGCEVLLINEDEREFAVAGTDYRIKEGDLISINGSSGEVILGEVPMIEGELSPKLKTLLGWADEIRDLGVWTNADYPRDARRARDFGAEGIGLCRTEHMFFEPERLPIVQQMILAPTDEEREAFLAQLLPFQRSDFDGIFKAMDGCPVIIRLIDPPLHEFLPKYDDLLVEVTELRFKGDDPALLQEKEELLEAVELMRESNPMLGLRGIRLGITMPGITRMQVRAIFEAACNCAHEGVVVKPEIMIPLTGHVNELKVARGLLEPVAQAVMEEKGITVEYKFGTMIEIPRAALTADQVAEYAEFFSYGTNDLTQTTFGYSRDDAEGKFLLKYVEMGILPVNPFQTLDRDGVGKLVRMGVELGRQTRPDLEVGICGEHGGDPNSIEFCHMVGLNYVSCSPFRVPVARLAAAQAAIRFPRS